MRPYIICHMGMSIDGRPHPSRFTSAADGVSRHSARSLWGNRPVSRPDDRCTRPLGDGQRLCRERSAPDCRAHPMIMQGSTDRTGRSSK
jgi:hypothetical protein